MTKRVLVKHANLVDGTQVDILIEDGKIAKIASSLSEANIDEIIEIGEDEFVSSGWIDIHTHAFDKFELYGDDADEIGYKQGVTMVIDAGTAGANDIETFYHEVKDKHTRVYSMMNISKPGIYAQYELSDMNDVDAQAFIDAYERFPDFIIGMKARMSKSVVKDNNVAPLEVAVATADKIGLPLMVHIGSNPPELNDIFSLMRPGDIVTHIYNPKENGILDKDGKVKDFVYAAQKKGLLFDLGHGTDSFSFDTCEKGLSQGIELGTISSDIYFRNRQAGPVYSLANTMDKMIMCGLSIEEVIWKVTTASANSIRMLEYGKLEPGYIADLTIFKIVNEPVQLIDSVGKKVEGTTQFIPTAVYVKDTYLDLSEVK